MGTFLTPLNVTKIEDRTRSGRELYRLENDLVYETAIKGTRYRFTVPVGYETDFVTTPSLFKWILPLVKMQRSATIHDMLCQNYTTTKKFCDQVFLDAMKTDKVFFYWRYVSYLYVRYRAKRVQWMQPNLTPIVDDLGNIIGWKECLITEL